MNQQMQNPIVLTTEQEDLIRSSFESGDSPDLSDLTRIVFNDNTLDGRSKQGRAIKEYIAQFKIGSVSVRSPKKGKNVELTEEQKEKILEQIKNPEYSCLNIARDIFDMQNITPFFAEFKAVSAFVDNHVGKNKIDQGGQLHQLESKTEDELLVYAYSPTARSEISKNLDPYKNPANITQAIYRINKYLNYGWKEDSIKKSQLKSVEALLGYLKVFRLHYQINSYSRLEDRDLFEDAFIRYTYDKDDLTQEELDQFITLSNEVVIAADIQRRIEYLRMSLDYMASESDGRKISMSLNEAINNAQTEYNQCISRQDKLYKNLTVNRSKRIEEKRNENASILNLVYAWKHEENRARMIALAERQRQAMNEEIEKLSSIDEFKAIIRGLDPKEIFNT
jgi:hypothetical protein